MNEEPFEYHTIVYKDRKSFATRSKSYSFDTKAERDYFAASKKDCFHKDLWQHTFGKKGNKKTTFHVCIHYLRNEKESS